MELSHCEEILVLAEQLSFSKAANRLFITQSALSKHVAAAEREVGFRIFERSTSKVELTESGRAFVEGLHSTVSAYEVALEEGMRRSQEAVETVRVVGPLTNERVLPLLTAARARMVSPKTEVSLTDIGLRDGLGMLAERRADLAVAFFYGDGREGLRSEHLAFIPFGVACCKDHPLARKSPLTFRDVAAEARHITSYPLEHRSDYHDFVRRTCERHGIHAPMRKVEEGSLILPELRDSVVFGVHYPGFARLGDDIVSRPLDEGEDLFDLRIVRREGEGGPAVLRLFDEIVSEFGGRA